MHPRETTLAMQYRNLSRPHAGLDTIEVHQDCVWREGRKVVNKRYGRRRRRRRYHNRPAGENVPDIWKQFLYRSAENTANCKPTDRIPHNTCCLLEKNISCTRRTAGSFSTTEVLQMCVKTSKQKRNTLLDSDYTVKIFPIWNCQAFSNFAACKDLQNFLLLFFLTNKVRVNRLQRTQAIGRQLLYSK